MEYLFTQGIVFYITGLAALTLLVGFFLRRRLSSLEGIRRKRLSQKKNIDSLAAKINKSVDEDKIKKERLDSLEKRFSITRRSLYLALILVFLFGASIPVIRNVSPMFVSIIVASISVIIGIAAKPFIENLICGLVLCFGRLARIGDTVLVDSEYGVIEDVTLTHCIIRRWDWLRYVVPNSSMMTKEFVNYSLRDNHRWVHVEFWIDYKANIATVEKIAKSSPRSSSYFSGKEEPRFWVIDMTPESIKCLVVAWATSAADGWMLSIDIRKNLLTEFQKQGIQTHLRNIAVKRTESEQRLKEQL